MGRGGRQHEGERNKDKEDMFIVCIIILAERLGRNYASFFLALGGDRVATAFFLQQKLFKLPFPH
jgi:hypothetical protein